LFPTGSEEEAVTCARDESTVAVVVVAKDRQIRSANHTLAPKNSGVVSARVALSL